MNAYQSMVELQDTIDQVLAGFLNNVNYNVVREECLELVKSDVSLSRHAKPVRDQLLSNLGVGRSERGDMLRMKYILEHAIAAVNSYLNWVLDDLETAFSDHGVSEYELDRLTSALATEALSGGRSQRALYNLKRVLLTPRPFPESWSQFRHELFCRRTFTCCFALKTPADSGVTDDGVLKALTDSGINVVKGSCLVDDLLGLAKAVSTNSYYLVYRVHAPDPYSAADTARSRLSSNVDFMRFFHLDGLTASPNCSVIEHGSSRPLNVQEHDSAGWLKLKPRFNANLARGLAEMLLDSSYPEYTISNLRGALRHHRIASESVSHSSRFLSLWVALESFCRCEFPDSSIQGIRERIPKVLCRRYLYRLLRNYAEDCDRVDPSILNGVVDRAGSQLDRVRSLLEAIQDPQQRASIEARCTPHSLLRHRMIQLHDVFTTPSRLKQILQHHCTSLDRHLQRLYRVRNMIAHRGDPGESLDANSGRLQLLADHLEEYLVEAVLETSHLMRTAEIKDLRTAFARVQDNHDAVQSILAQSKNIDIDLVLSGCI
ncbi:MAG: hypothetical protein ACM3ZU_08450 [Bacteroidota bacterium]